MVERQVKPSVVFRWDFVHSLNVLNPKTSAVQKVKGYAELKL